MSQIKDVYDFQTKILFNEFPREPIPLSKEMKTQTLTCLQEELFELKEAEKTSDQADALVDLIYFAYGALHKMGVATQTVWDEVHRANMTKVRGKTKRNHEDDATKPDTWKAPDHTWLDR